jgi:hypothetical protein
MNKQTQKDLDYLALILCPYGKQALNKAKKYKSLEDYITKNTDKVIEFLEAVGDIILDLEDSKYYFSLYLAEADELVINYILERFYDPNDQSEFTLTKKEIKVIINRFKYIVEVLKNFLGSKTERKSLVA